MASSCDADVAKRAASHEIGLENAATMLVAPTEDQGSDLRQLCASPQAVSQLVVKVASRCNIDCSYCYWFRDPSVYRRPKLMSELVANQLLQRVKEHVLRNSLSQFCMVLHGGEPLLWGRSNFELFSNAAQRIAKETACQIDLTVTTNGVLIDEEWVDCFEKQGIQVTVSIDGPANIHDAWRKTFRGGPTHALVERGIRLLQSKNFRFGVLAVCDPSHTAREYFDYFASIGVSGYDILFPDVTFKDEPSGVGTFYHDLFDLWLTANQKERTVSIRVIEDKIACLVGGNSSSDGTGYAPEEITTILTDGSMEPLDVLRIAGDSSTRTTYNVFDNAIQDIVDEPRWGMIREASINLCDKCKKCKFMIQCGGGYLPHRFSEQNGYDNPSVYCDDLYSLFEHMQNKIHQHLYLKTQSGECVNVTDAIRQAADKSIS